MKRGSSMKKYDLRTLIFLALCCDLGLFSKRMIAPFANVITDSLHIPGGIGTSFSLMFLVIAAMLVEQFGCATIMGAVQSGLALGLGMTGSMGALSPIGYIMPGIATDVILYLTRNEKMLSAERMSLANALAAVCAALSANIIVFHLRGAALLLYICVGATSGAVCGLIGERLFRRLNRVIRREPKRENAKQEVQP